MILVTSKSVHICDPLSNLAQKSVLTKLITIDGFIQYLHYYKVKTFTLNSMYMV